VQDFNSFELSAPLQKAVREMGFTTPTAIQAQTLPILLGEPTDFLGLAATGTGKTAAFAIPMLSRIDPAVKAVQALILCPTRELAVQVSGQISLLGKYMGIKSVAVYGGASYADQIMGLKHGAAVVVGTPGRVVDHLTRGNLKLGKLQVLILDEADEMISMGFKEEMEEILQSVPEGTSNTWLFSATMNPHVSRVAKTYLKSPQQVQANRGEMVPSKVEQLYYSVRESDKPEILCKLIDSAEDFYGLVFCQTKALVTELSHYLHERGYKVDSLHGDKDQTARERTLHAFRERRVSVLICTDVASRGIDVKDITHVVNYSLPRELDNYVHRIGRTARSGKNGIAMNLVTASHRRLIFEIEKLTKTRMTEGRIPTRKEIAAKKITSILPTFENQPFQERARDLLSEEWRLALAEMNPLEVAARFLTMMMPDVINDKAQDTVMASAPQEQRPRQYQQRDDRRPRSGGQGGHSAHRSTSGPRTYAAPRSAHGPRSEGSQSTDSSDRGERRPFRKNKYPSKTAQS